MSSSSKMKMSSDHGEAFEAEETAADSQSRTIMNMSEDDCAADGGISPPCRGCCCGPDCCYTYEYEELLGCLYKMLTDNNPVLASGERCTTVLRTPHVLREGTRKTILANFMEICKLMHREPEHVMSFYLAEMGTSGSLDGTQMLVVRGRFAPRNFEVIQPRYVNEYVMCQGCKGADTVLFKENRLIFLRCEDCGSTRSVAPVKAGFVARVGRRNRSWFRKT